MLPLVRTLVRTAAIRTANGLCSTVRPLLPSSVLPQFAGTGATAAGATAISARALWMSVMGVKDVENLAGLFAGLHAMVCFVPAAQILIAAALRDSCNHQRG